MEATHFIEQYRYPTRPDGEVMNTQCMPIQELGHELNPQYFLDGAAHLKAAEYKINIPTLFDLEEISKA